jgi:hypothetical protein
MKNGQTVIVETFDHKLIECRLVETRGETAIVCSEREWRLARREKREPDCLGWPLSSVREKEAISTSTATSS